MRGENARDTQKVGGPVAEADHQSEAKDDARPVNAHGVIPEVPGCAPQVRVVAGTDACGDLRFQVGPAAGLDEAEDGDQERAQPDEKELQNLIENGRPQAAQGDVDGDGDGGDPDGEVKIPAQNHFNNIALRSNVQ